MSDSKNELGESYPMGSFSWALEQLKLGYGVKREVVKNDTVIILYKDGLYHYPTSTGIRYSYSPSNTDMLANDWRLVVLTNIPNYKYIYPNPPHMRLELARYMPDVMIDLINDRMEQIDRGEVEVTIHPKLVTYLKAIASLEFDYDINDNIDVDDWEHIVTDNLFIRDREPVLEMNKQLSNNRNTMT